MEIVYIILGWLFGLLSPSIVKKIESKYEEKKFILAIKRELKIMQFHLCIVGFQLGQKYGSLDRDYLISVRNILDDYDGEDDATTIISFIDSMLALSGAEFNLRVQELLADKNASLRLKTYSTIFIDANSSKISDLPIHFQSKLYEFKAVLNIYNQEAVIANKSSYRTFDSSISDVNHQILKSGILESYSYLQRTCIRLCGKIQGILDFRI